MSTNKDNTEKKGFFKKLIGDVAENVSEGASFIGKKVSEGASAVGEKVAETSAKAYVASSEIIADTSEKIHDFTEKQHLQKDEKTLLSRQVELSNEFGKLTLDHYLKNDSLHKTFLNTKPIADMVDEFKANVKKINKIEKDIKKLENH